MVYNIEYFSKKTETEKCVLSFKYIVYSHIHVLKCMKSSNLFFATKSSISFCRVMLYKDKKILISYPFIQIASSVQFSCSLVSDSLRSHGLQHTRLPCPSPIPGAYTNLFPSSQWCHPTISSSVVPFSFCLQSFPASGSFLMSQFFVSGGQSIRVSVSASVLPINIQDWFPLGLTGLISLQSKGLSRVFSNTTVWKHQFDAQPSLWPNSHIHTWLLEKPVITVRTHKYVIAFRAS